jgi:hypothetical protein
MNDQNNQRVFDSQTLIERLKALREEVESAGDITRMLAPFPNTQYPIRPTPAR